MSFIGSDGLDHQLKQLKSQLASKGKTFVMCDHSLSGTSDSELTSIRNEQRKRTEEQTETKRSQAAVQYQVSSLMMGGFG